MDLSVFGLKMIATVTLILVIVTVFCIHFARMGWK